MAQQRLWIVGAGGLGAEVLHTARQLWRPDENGEHSIAFAVDDPQTERFLGVDVRRTDDIAPGDLFAIAIGSGRARERLHRQLVAKGARAHAIVAPTAIIGLGVDLGEGSLLSDYTMLTGDVVVGQQFQCNIYSYVAHDCVIGDFVTFAPRVSCNGNVHIDDHAYLGAGCVLKQGTSDKPLRIGAGATVGMGAVVTKDVPPGVTVIGNPARPLER